MLAAVLGSSPIVELGLVAWWAQARRVKLELVNMCGDARTSKRSPHNEQIDAVVLHQMGLSRGNDLLRHRLVTAHFVIMPDGHIAQLRLTSARLSASHCFNGRSVAIEFAGNLRSTDGRWWRPETYGRDTLTAAQVESGRNLLRALASQRVRFVYAHRQSYDQRGNDPGLRFLGLVGQWAIDKLGIGRPRLCHRQRPARSPSDWRTCKLDTRNA